MPRKKGKNQGLEYLPSKKGSSKVAEAATVIYTAGEEGPAVTTISSKNQITLPAHMLRDMGLHPGDRLTISRDGNRIVLRGRPKDWVRHYAGSLSGLYGGTRDDVDRYVQGLRDEGARATEIERAWAGGTRSAKE